MKIYLVRHGEVISNALKHYNEDSDDLTELGIKQAEELREKIKTIEIDAIFCSPLLRAKHTASIINENHKPIIYDDRIKERNVGDFGGRPLTVTNRDEYWNYNTSLQYGTSENIKLFFKRVYQFLEELKNQPYECILIVAHSGVSKAFSAYFEGIQDGMFLNRGLKNCEMKEYDLK